MKQLTQDKRLLAIIGIVLLLLLIGSYYFLTSKKTTSVSTTTSSSSDMVQTLTPEDVGLSIQPHVGSKCSTTPTPYNEVRIVLNKASDIKHIAWQFVYNADIPKSDQVQGADSVSQVGQELVSESDNTTGSQFTSHYEFLGTCSKNVCRCDTGVKSVHLVLKITKNDGKTYKVQADKPFSLSSGSE